MLKLGPLEILFIETIFYFLLWMANDYLATMFSLILGSIFFLILLVSLIVEFIERSRVPRWYFTFMAMSVAAPILAAAIFFGVSGGTMEWMTE